MSDRLTITLTPYKSAATEPDDHDYVSITAILENTSADSVTVRSMTSQVFHWDVTDSDNRSYMPTFGYLQAPHQVTIEPGMAYVTTLRLQPPKSVEERYNDRELWDNPPEPITDPREIEDITHSDRENIVIEPAVPLSLDEELTATLRVDPSDTEEPVTAETTFIPAALTENTENNVIPNSVTIDDGAALSMTGRTTDESTIAWNVTGRDS